jgi:multimeric flavodoxin WrbA
MKTKNLVIHDLEPAEWDKVSSRYSDWNIVTDNGSIHPCTGCFSCWNRTSRKNGIKPKDMFTRNI